MIDLKQTEIYVYEKKKKKKEELETNHNRSRTKQHQKQQPWRPQSAIPLLEGAKKEKEKEKPIFGVFFRERDWVFLQAKCLLECMFRLFKEPFFLLLL